VLGRALRRPLAVVGQHHVRQLPRREQDELAPGARGVDLGRVHAAVGAAAALLVAVVDQPAEHLVEHVRLPARRGAQHTPLLEALQVLDAAFVPQMLRGVHRLHIDAPYTGGRPRGRVAPRDLGRGDPARKHSLEEQRCVPTARPGLPLRAVFASAAFSRAAALSSSGTWAVGRAISPGTAAARLLGGLRPRLLGGTVAREVARGVREVTRGREVARRFG